MNQLYGLILAGGSSTRMGQDKAFLSYQGIPQLQAAYEAMAPLVEKCFVSVRPDQTADPLRARFPRIEDRGELRGPAAGILAAHEAYPDRAFLVVACDLPFLDETTLKTLIAERDDRHIAVACRSEHDGLPEPLCTIWEPEALDELVRQVERGQIGLRKLLADKEIRLLEPRTAGALDNINTPQEREAAQKRIGGTMIQVTVEYFAQMREIAGHRTEVISTVSTSAEPLYEELRDLHGFPFDASRLRVAINGDFALWTQPLKDGDQIVFIPPVTGG
ncbi:NTP transferase domain-containing protein [Gluconobacter morbifer]|uniref:Molybdenum cofactor guanylyltransferase n=1 Tax=Gluconobacter morbifer G707 TaxID=1088869 RepID=G6XLT4_9PROT|nr:NTP transferase domain-containing protein [Gluconobacter morbifer]EHH67339.1 molybdenum cofactor biosynthesis protein [Gluconobacter morbifer G707]